MSKNDKDSTAGSTIRSGAIAANKGSAKEAFFGLLCGTTFGVTSVLVGHPFDTVKTRMQVLNYNSMGKTIKHIMKDSGVRGLYSGMLPMLLGSAVFRSAQFSAYSFGFAKSQELNPMFGEAIPNTGGFRPAVFVGCLLAGTARALIECPLEVVKIQRQITLSSSKFILRDAYKGFVPMWLRSTGLISCAFIGFDYSVRYFPKIMGTPITGDFLKGSVIATLAWVLIWPSEVVKNHAQAGLNNLKDGSNNSAFVNTAKRIYQSQGFKAFYRGMMPGMMRSIFANGFSMVAYQGCQRLRLDYV